MYDANTIRTALELQAFIRDRHSNAVTIPQGLGAIIDNIVRNHPLENTPSSEEGASLESTTTTRRTRATSTPLEYPQEWILDKHALQRAVESFENRVRPSAAALLELKTQGPRESRTQVPSNQ